MKPVIDHKQTLRLLMCPLSDRMVQKVGLIRARLSVASWIRAIRTQRCLDLRSCDI